nr:RNA 2',3'-cyclic phosphodiesterase [Candidatus Njordarchaeota archaeon]
MDKIRAFIAVELDPQLLQKVLQLQQEILAVGADMKAVEAENIHFTLKFLGEIPPYTVNEVIARMDKLDYKSFTIEIAGTGCFPTPRNPRVIWIGVTSGRDEFAKVAKQLENYLREIGFRPEGERFTPHLTIGRVRSGRNRADLIQKLNETLDVEVGKMIVNTIKLKKSMLTPRGPIYTTLHEVKGKP